MDDTRAIVEYEWTAIFTEGVWLGNPTGDEQWDAWLATLPQLEAYPIGGLVTNTQIPIGDVTRVRTPYKFIPKVSIVSHEYIDITSRLDGFDWYHSPILATATSSTITTGSGKTNYIILDTYLRGYLPFSGSKVIDTGRSYSMLDFYLTGKEAMFHNDLVNPVPVNIYFYHKTKTLFGGQARTTDTWSFMIGTSSVKHTLSLIEEANQELQPHPDSISYGRKQFGIPSLPGVLSSHVRTGQGYKVVGIIYSSKPPKEINNKFANKPKPRSLPEVNDDCDCELLEDIYEMLGGDDFRDKGLIVPNNLYAPQGKGSTVAKNYNGLFNLLFRTLDHRTVGECVVNIPDNNKMMKGNQPLQFISVNATGAFNKLLELSFDNQGDSGVQLNLLMRVSWLLTQVFKVLVITREATKTISSFFGIPTRQEIEMVDLPIDPSLGGKIGNQKEAPKDDEITKILDLDDPEKTESILDSFMNNSKMPVPVWKFIRSSKGGDFWWFLNKNKK